jgi:hypothetical protein
MGVQLDAKKADGKTLTINWIFPDINEKHALFLENSVLNHWPDYTDAKADVTVTVERATLTKVLTKQLSFEDAVKTGLVKFTGNPAKFVEFMLPRRSEPVLLVQHRDTIASNGKAARANCSPALAVRLVHDFNLAGKTVEEPRESV